MLPTYFTFVTCKLEYPYEVAFFKSIRKLTGEFGLPCAISILSTNSGSIGRRSRLGIPKTILVYNSSF